MTLHLDVLAWSQVDLTWGPGTQRSLRETDRSRVGRTSEQHRPSSAQRMGGRWCRARPRRCRAERRGAPLDSPCPPGKPTGLRFSPVFTLNPVFPEGPWSMLGCPAQPISKPGGPRGQPGRRSVPSTQGALPRCPGHGAAWGTVGRCVQPKCRSRQHPEGAVHLWGRGAGPGQSAAAVSLVEGLA